MTRNQWWKTTCAFAAVTGLLQPTALLAAGQDSVTFGPRSSALVASRMVSPASEPTLTPTQKIALLQKNIKYVFVLFQENRSFDQHFGTFPGANGIGVPGAQPGYSQPIVNTDGTVGTISPFKIPNTVVNTAGKTVQLYPADTDSVDHSHAGIDNSIDYTGGKTLNDRYALNEEGLTTSNGAIVSRSTGAPLASLANPSLANKQRAELVMSHLDCDTIPFLWQYADRFAMFDNFHMTVTGPSTPNAIAMIAGQSGLTQWALHPSEAASNIGGTSLASSGGEPVVADPGPFAGSNLDQSPVKPPYGPNDEIAGHAGAEPDLCVAAAVVHGQRHRQDHPVRREPGAGSPRRAERHRVDFGEGHAGELGLVPGRLRPRADRWLRPDDQCNLHHPP